MKKLFTKKDKRTKLQKEIDVVLEDLSTLRTDSKEYADMLNVLERLYKLRGEEKPQRMKPDTLLLVGGNLLGILLVLNYEKLDTITSKALSFALRGRV